MRFSALVRNFKSSGRAQISANQLCIDLLHSKIGDATTLRRKFLTKSNGVLI
jgi:hypothetical protein